MQIAQGEARESSVLPHRAEAIVLGIGPIDANERGKLSVCAQFHNSPPEVLQLLLLSALTDRGYCNAYAGITLPNEASVALHRAVGFTPIGTFPAVGRKFNKWHDVAWFYRSLRQLPPEEQAQGEA